MTSRHTDSDILRNDYYRDPESLKIRAEFFSYSTTTPQELDDWRFKRIKRGVGDPAEVLDLGCGTGKLWQRFGENLPSGWTLNLSDLSDGMIKAARKNFSMWGIDGATFHVLNASDLPFPNQHFNLVVANYVLYHVPDLDRTLSEIRRVLKPKGRLFAMTNGVKHMQELKQVVRQTLPKMNFGSSKLTEWDFLLDNSRDRLKQHFANVELSRLPTGIRVDQAQPVVDYILSLAPLYDDVYRDEDITALHDAVQRLIDEDKALHITEDTGAFMAWGIKE